jgi:hypothetical protein
MLFQRPKGLCSLRAVLKTQLLSIGIICARKVVPFKTMVTAGALEFVERDVGAYRCPTRAAGGAAWMGHLVPGD